MAGINSKKTRQIPKRHFNYWPLLIILIIIIMTALLRIPLLNVPLERDEGEYAYAGQLILQGIWPYHAPSLYKYKMPGAYFIYAIILALFGQTPVAIHTGLLLANLAAIIVLFLLTRKLFGHIAALTAAAAYSILSISPSVLGIFAHSEHFVVLAALAGILLLLESIDSYRWPKLFAAGALLGSAFVIRQHAAAFILFAALYFLYTELKKKSLSLKCLLSKGLLFCAGLAVPFFVTCAIFLAVGVFDRFWFWTFIYARKYLSMLPFSVGINMFRLTAIPMIASSPLLWILAAIGFIALLCSRKIRMLIPFTLGFLAFSFLAVCPGLYFREHYFIFLLPAVALLIGIAVDSTAQLLSKFNFFLPGKAFAILFILIALYQSFYNQYSFLFQRDLNRLSRMTYGPNPFPESLNIAAYIKENSSKNDSVAILGSEPQILFYAQRHSATGYTDTYEMMKKHDYALQMQKEMIQEIEQARPRFLVFVNVLASWVHQPDSKTLIFDWFRKYQSKYYQQVGVVDIISNTSTVYLWNEQSVGYTPKSEYWISVFKRKNNL